MHKDIVVGLDIGTTKICATVAEPSKEGTIRVIGVGTAPSKGLRKGVVVNLEDTVHSIGEAIDEAERVSHCDIRSVFAGIAGGHVKSQNTRGKVSITADTKEITAADVERVIESAQAITLSIDREIIHAIPQEFYVDGQPGVKNPVGLSGMRLEADVHVVTGNVMSAQNIIKAIHLADLKVEDIVLQPLASSLAILSDEDKEIGVALIDIGGGTTDFIVYSDGVVRHSDVLSLGGDDITRDIGKVLALPETKAEHIKLSYGKALDDQVRDVEVFPLPATLGRREKDESLKTLAQIIGERMSEILTITKEEIERNGCARLVGGGVVLTGGAVLLEDTSELARRVFNNIPVRLGQPVGLSGAVDGLDNPILATGIGLAKYGIEFRQRGEHPIDTNRRKIFTNLLGKFQSWVRQLFKGNQLPG